MNRQEELVSEYETEFNEDLKNRKKSIEDGESLDKEIHRRMDAGEIGISYGTDNHIGVIMLFVATIFTLIALYFIFGMSPDYFKV